MAFHKLKRDKNYTAIDTLMSKECYSDEEIQIIRLYFLEELKISKIASATEKNIEAVRNFVEKIQFQILKIQPTEDFRKAKKILYKEADRI